MDLEGVGGENMPADGGGGGGRRKKRRSSILKPTRPVLQDIETNVVEEAATVTKSRSKSRRVSFSRTQQVKEFMAGQDHATIWNSTYEEDHSHASIQAHNSQGASSIQAHTSTQSHTTMVHNQGSAVSHVRGVQPLQINIPDASSPNKFLPTNPGLDTSTIFHNQAAGSSGVSATGFLQGLQSGQGNLGGDESEDFYATSLDKTCRDNEAMSRTMIDDSAVSLDSSTNNSKVDAMGFLAGLCGGETSKNTDTIEKAEKTFHMDMTCKMNKTGIMEMTCNMDITNAQTTENQQTKMNFTQNLDYTCAPTQQEVTTDHQAVVNTQQDLRQSSAKSRLSSIQSNWTRDTVFEDDQPQSGNSSFDGGATATIKFTGLSLANNTLILPRRESQEEDDDDDMTRVPVQTFTYNAEDPVHTDDALQDNPGALPAQTEMYDITRDNNRTMAGAFDMDMTRTNNRTLAAPSDMEMTRANNRTLAAPSDMEMTRANNRTLGAKADIEMPKADNKTVASTTGMEMTKAAVKTTEMPQLPFIAAKATLPDSSKGFEQSPEPTCIIGGMMHQGINKFMNQGDISTFMPEGESTRAFNFQVKHPVPQTAGIFEDDEDINNLLSGVPVGESTRTVPPLVVPKPVDLDITSFNPGGESTRAVPCLPVPKPIDFDVSCFNPGGESTRAVPRLPVSKPVEMGDITSFNPTGESTSSVPPLPITKPVTFDVTSFNPEGESTRAVPRLPIPKPIEMGDQVTSSPPQQYNSEGQFPKSPDFGDDITSFAPRIESTRAINFPIPKPNSIEISDENEMINNLSLSPIGKYAEKVDVKEVENYTERKETNPKISKEISPLDNIENDKSETKDDNEDNKDIPANDNNEEQTLHDDVEQKQTNVDLDESDVITDKNAKSEKEDHKIPNEGDIDLDSTVPIQQEDPRTEICSDGKPEEVRQCIEIYQTSNAQDIHENPPTSDTEVRASYDKENVVSIEARTMINSDEMNVVVTETKTLMTKERLYVYETESREHETEDNELKRSLEASSTQDESPTKVQKLSQEEDFKEEIAKEIEIVKEIETAEILELANEMELVKEISENKTKDLGIKSRKSFKVRKSEVPSGMRKSMFMEQIDIFQDLKWKLEQKDKVTCTDWDLFAYDLDGKNAIFTWFERAVKMVVKLGNELEIKRSRKSLGRCVTHFTIESINLAATSPEILQDPAADLAIHLLTRKMSNQIIESKCPNTHSLGSLLDEVSELMSQTIEMFKCLDYVQNSFPTTIKDNVVTIDFSSPGLRASFQVQVDYSDGISSALNSIQIKPKPWNNNDLVFIKKVVKNMTRSSPGFIKNLCEMCWTKIQEHEARL